MIRKADVRDIPAVLELMRQFHAESLYAPYDLDENKLERLLNVAIAPNETYLCLVADDGEVYGFLLGFVMDMWFGGDKMAGEFGVYISKLKRGGPAAIRIIKSFENWAVAKGAKFVSLGISAGIETDKVAGIYERLGYERDGAICRKYMEVNAHV